MKQAFILFLALFLLSLSNCTNDKQAKQQGNTTTQVAQKPALILNAHRYLVADDQLYKQYEASYKQPVSVYKMDSEQIIQKAQKGELQGDLVMVKNLYYAHQLKQMGLLAPFNASSFGDSIPSQYIDKEGYWAGLTRFSMGFVFNRHKINLDDTRFYVEIIKPKYQGRVVMAHPDSSSITTFVAGMLAANGPEATQTYLSLLKKNLAKPASGSDRDALQALIDDEADIAFMNTATYLRYKNSGNAALYQQLAKLHFEIPTDAKQNNYYDISPICVLKQTNQWNALLPFIDELCLRNKQNTFAEAMMEYPVNVFSSPSNLVDDAFNLPQGAISMDQVEEQLDTAREMIRRVFSL